MKPTILLALCLLIVLPVIASGEISTVVVVIPAPSSPPSPGGGSSSGGTGGGGIITDEPFSNILKYESKENMLISGKPVRYTFSRYPDMPVYEIELIGKENENDITVKVELLKGLSPKVSGSPTGVVYRYFNAYSGSRRIQEAKIRFKVSNEWLTDNNIAEINLNRWNGTAWQKLETSRIKEDNTNTFYESTAPSFSNFVIIGASSSPSPTGTETVQPENPYPTATVTPGITETPGFEGIIAIMILLLAARRKNTSKIKEVLK